MLFCFHKVESTFPEMDAIFHPGFHTSQKVGPAFRLSDGPFNTFLITLVTFFGNLYNSIIVRKFWNSIVTTDSGSQTKTIFSLGMISVVVKG